MGEYLTLHVTIGYSLYYKIKILCIYKEMETESTKQKIQAIKEIFKNIRDTLARDKINEIRTNIYKKETIFDFLTNKDKLKSSERKVLIRINDYFNKLMMIY